MFNNKKYLEKVVVCWEVFLLDCALHLGLSRGGGQQVFCIRRKATFLYIFSSLLTVGGRFAKNLNLLDQKKEEITKFSY
jgi:hypothetical protein